MRKIVSIVLILMMSLGMTTAYAADIRPSSSVAREPKFNILDKKGFEGTNDDDWELVNLAHNDLLMIRSISEFTLQSGSALFVYIDGEVEYHGGRVQKNGITRLTRDRNYKCDIKTRNTESIALILATGSARIDVSGSYKVVKSQTTAFVERLYTNILGQRSDTAGLRHWVGMIDTGEISAEAVVRSFFTDEKYHSRRDLTDIKYVDILYNALFNRKPTGEERSYWVGRIRAGATHQSILDVVLSSREFTDVCNSYGLSKSSQARASNGLQLFMLHLYRSALDRLPDRAGGDAWISRIQDGATGSQIASEIILSAEMTSRGLSNRRFIELLYLTLFGRRPDTEEETYWVNYLQRGSTRSDVVGVFVASQEFAAFCGIFGVKP